MPPKDARKLLQLKRSVCAPPVCKFSTGNITTLRDGPAAAGRDMPRALADLWAQRYTSDVLCGAVVGPQDLDTLEAWVRECFAGVRQPAMPTGAGASAGAPGAAADGGASSAEEMDVCPSATAAAIASVRSSGCDELNPGDQLQQPQSAGGSLDPLLRYGPQAATGPTVSGRMFCVLPQRDLRHLELTWRIPYSSLAHAACKPWRWAAHVLGHESHGSVAAYLKSRGWAQELSAGGGEEVRLGAGGGGYMMWGVGIELTEAGQAALPQVVAAVRQGVAALAAIPEDRRAAVWAEVAELMHVRFNYQVRRRRRALP